MPLRMGRGARPPPRPGWQRLRRTVRGRNALARAAVHHHAHLRRLAARLMRLLWPTPPRAECRWQLSVLFHGSFARNWFNMLDARLGNKVSEPAAKRRAGLKAHLQSIGGFGQPLAAPRAGVAAAGQALSLAGRGIARGVQKPFPEPWRVTSIVAIRRECLQLLHVCFGESS